MVRELWQTEVRTPNLDQLARQGTTFTHAYNMGAWGGAVCVASRTMLNTGRTVWRAQALTQKPKDGTKKLPIQLASERGEFWSQQMQRAGYETYMTGKWHVKVGADRVFRSTTHIRPGMPNQTKAGYDRPVEGAADPWSPYNAKFEGFWRGGKHWSEVVADDAVGFIETASKSKDPFFMYLAFNAPHDPRQSPKKYVEMYPQEKVKVPGDYLSLYPHADKIGCGKNLRDERLAPFPRTEYAVRVNRQEYFAIITHMDEQIGRILKALEASGKRDNTYVIFTSDHGLACGHHGLMGKQNMYDHSVRVPLIVAGPKVPKNKRLEMDVYMQDVMPTTLELAGQKKPEYVEFSSLFPLIQGKQSNSNYDAIYGAYLQGMQRMVRKDGWKLIVYPQAKTLRLYHVATDPQEERDLAKAGDQQQRIKDLFAELLKLQKKYDDTLDLQAVFPEMVGAN